MKAGPQHRSRTLLLCGVLHAFTHSYNVALLPLYLLMQRDLGLGSVDGATLLVTVMMLAYFLPGYLVGVLADRVSRKQLLGWGLLVNGLGFVGLSFASSYPVALLWAVVTGLGGCCYHPAATAMIARLYPRSAGRAFGLVGIGASAGFFLSPLYAGWRAGRLEAVQGAAAWRVPVLEMGVLGIVAALVFLWLAEEQEPSRDSRVGAGRPERMFATPLLWLVFVGACLALSLRDFSGASVASLGSLFLQKAHGADARFAGMALSCMFLASAVSNPLFGRLSDHGRFRWLAVTLLASALVIAVFPFVPRNGIPLVFLVFGFFFMAGYPMTEAALMESVPDSVRGRVVGVFITIGGLVGNLSHWLVGVWVRHLGERAQTPSGYLGTYSMLAALVVFSLLALPCLRALRSAGRVASVPDAGPEGFPVPAAGSGPT